ncbi:MAG: tetratricopeptide repeat protein [Treponema sp.]|jgi:tetratricopeptide (TPR) repeat protein|nr:tetratricopeptide repeat protein [Treponema sp.]
MTIALAVIIVLGVGVAFLVTFLVKSMAVPRRVEALESFIKRGKTQTVIKAARAIAAREPKNAEAHYWLGTAYHLENRDELALMEFKTANQIGISGKNIPEIPFRELLGQLFIRYNQEEEALKEYLLLIKLMPNRADYYYHAGKLFAGRNRKDMAENYLRKAASLAPKDGKIHYELGAMLYRDKKTKEAKAALEVALKYQSDNPQIHFFLGKIQKDVKNYQGALPLFEKAARDAQFRIRALVERGGCFMALNAPERAIPDLERAAGAITDEDSGDSLYARYFLGMCYEKIRDVDKAIAQWEKIYERKKNFRDVGEKLSRYQELRTDDNMKDYLTSGQGEFVEICKSLAEQKMDLHVQGSKNIGDGCEFTAVENDSAKWRNARKMPRLIRFYRSPDPVDEPKIRSILDDAKDQNIPRAVVITSAGFSRAALDYANSRPVELFGKEKLQELLQGINKEGTAGRT